MASAALSHEVRLVPNLGDCISGARRQSYP